MYAKYINRIRVAVAVIMAVSGAGFVICANLAPGTPTEFAPEVEPIGIAFVIGVYFCLAFTVGLVLEGLVRWWIRGRSQPFPANASRPQPSVSRNQPGE